MLAQCHYFTNIDVLMRCDDSFLTITQGAVHWLNKYGRANDRLVKILGNDYFILLTGDLLVI